MKRTGRAALWILVSCISAAVIATAEPPARGDAEKPSPRKRGRPAAEQPVRRRTGEGLTPGQREKLQSIHYRSESKRIELRAELARARLDLRRELDKEKIDPERVMELFDKVTAAGQALAKVSMGEYLAVRKVVGKERADRLAKMILGRRGGGPGIPGFGPPEGPGFRRPQGPGAGMKRPGARAGARPAAPPRGPARRD